ncbi:MAG TPA: serine hydrolase [Polyangia bacterium]|nr:serine hydrolase [Polyangia bacterium]
MRTALVFRLAPALALVFARALVLAPALVLALGLTVAGCAHVPPPAYGSPAPATTAASASAPESGLAAAAPEAEGVDSETLVALTEWIRDNPIPIYSLLISRHGRLVYELYTSSLTREESHYLMSVTKSVLSALIGIAIDQGLVRGPDAAVSELLPRAWFAGDADVARFSTITLKHVLGMSALDAQVPPHRRLPEDYERQRQFLAARDRVAFALTQALLPNPGETFQYTDITPMIATGVLEYAAKRTALEFADENLFGPLGFRNQEWMHQDASGHDNGAYGLRLRPIDMQKLGVLFLRGGEWNGRRVISRGWIERSFTPWIHGDYGWYWWQNYFAPGWRAHVANGWKGQRIAVVPEQGVVVTMTGCIEDGAEDRVFATVMRRFVVPALGGGAHPELQSRLAQLIEEVRTGTSRIRPGVEPRMVPSIDHKERRKRHAL